MKKLFIWLFVCISLSACKKVDSDIPDDSIFFGRFNGYIASISTQNPPGAGQASYSASNIPSGGSQVKGSYASTIRNAEFAVTFRKQYLLFSGGLPSSSAFQGFFGAGNVPYLTGTVTDGIAINYIDKNGITWNSERGDQTGSVFTVTKSQPSGNNVKIESSFSCKLYNSNGDIIQLTGGSFTGQFRSN